MFNQAEYEAFTVASGLNVPARELGRLAIVQAAYVAGHAHLSLIGDAAHDGANVSVLPRSQREWFAH